MATNLFEIEHSNYSFLSTPDMFNFHDGGIVYVDLSSMKFSFSVLVIM